MEKVSTFIRKTNLKLCRQLKVIPITEVAKRFLIDNNAYSFDAMSEDTHSNQWGLYITKKHGKYVINYWRNLWDDTDIVEEKVSVTSDYRKVITAINNAIGAEDDWSSYDCWWVKDKYLNSVNWEVIKDPSDLYNDEETVDYGELPEGFEPVKEELEPVPEEIKL